MDANRKIKLPKIVSSLLKIAFFLFFSYIQTDICLDPMAWVWLQVSDFHI